MKYKKLDCSVALSYTFGTKAPIITAKGKGYLSSKILDIAKKNGIKIIQDGSLSNILFEQEIGSCIPEDTYEAIASIFTFLEKISNDDMNGKI